jgi:hypothetical protein
MPNQMIALQARNPQLPDPARATTRLANMMNMARQAEAAQLQGERTRQEMEYETELQAPRLAEAGAKADTERLKYAMLFYKESANDLINSNTPEQAVSRGERLKAMFPDPALQARIDETITDLVSDPSQFEAKRRQMLRNTLDAEKQLAIEHSDVFDAEGNLILMERSPVGAFPTRVTPGVITDLPSTATQASPPRATPTAGAGTSANMRATRGANTTPQDLMNQGMDPRNIPSGMPTSRPVSFNQSDMGGAGAGQMTPDVMSRIVNSAFETGVMAQVDFDQLLASQPPQNKQALMNAFQQANITLQADAPSLADSGMGQQQMAANPVQRPQSQFADLRGPAPQSQTAGLRGAPPMEQTLAQYQVGQQIKGRNPSMALTPSPVAPAILAAQETAKIKGIRAAGPPPLTPLQKNARKTEVAKAYTKTQALMDKAYNPKEGVIALANKIKALSDDQKESITGYSGYIPSFRASSREADTLIGNLKGVVTGLGKDAAAASGAIGPMAVQEWTIVADMIAKLDLEGMTPRALDAQMNRIIEQVRNATNLAERVYDVQYGDDIKEYPDFKLRGTPPAPRTKTPVTKAPAGVSATEWKAMTPAERKLWQ